jgi:hypothetical protein
MDNTELEDEDRGDLLNDEELDDEEALDEEDEIGEGEVDEEEVEEDEELEDEEDDSPSIAEILKQNEEAKARSAWLEEQLAKLISNLSDKEKKEAPPVVEFDFETAEEKYANLLIEGEHKDAAKLRIQIDTARRNELVAMMDSIKKSATEEATKSTSATLEATEFKALVRTLEKANPYLDVNSKSFNEEAVDTVNTLSAGYIAAGMTRSQALQKAVDKVKALYKEEAPSASIAAKRKVEAGKKAAKASAMQPGKTKSSAAPDSSVEMNISKMSDKDLAKLSLKELKALRGD